MYKFEIVFYEKENGGEPAKEFMKSGLSLLYFYEAGRRIILTNGFIKKTQKTPGKEIDKAKNYRSDYERRRGNDKL